MTYFKPKFKSDSIGSEHREISDAPPRGDTVTISTPVRYMCTFWACKGHTVYVHAFILGVC